MKKLWSVFLVLCMLLTGCGASEKEAAASTLSFSAANSLDEIKALDGKTVTIIGYMATLSPISGTYMYLMNMPYQSCPFCVPNTSQLANTMAVYAENGKQFAYTQQAIRVTGKMKVEDYTDEFGYTYNYRIVDASYAEVDLTEVSAEYALWQSIAQDGIVGEINSMFDYLLFVCQWTEYQSSYTDDNGDTITFYLYPGDARNYLESDSVYGYAKECSDSYYPELIARVKAIDAERLSDLVSIVEDSQILSQKALAELNNGAYTYNQETDQYTLDASEELYNEWYALWVRFSQWLAKWEI